MERPNGETNMNALQNLDDRLDLLDDAVKAARRAKSADLEALLSERRAVQAEINAIVSARYEAKCAAIAASWHAEKVSAAERELHAAMSRHLIHNDEISLGQVEIARRKVLDLRGAA